MNSELEKVIKEINEQAEIFRIQVGMTTKVSAMRARKATGKLRDLGKVFRKLSNAAK